MFKDLAKRPTKCGKRNSSYTRVRTVVANTLIKVVDPRTGTYAVRDTLEERVEALLPLSELHVKENILRYSLLVTPHPQFWIQPVRERWPILVTV
jgi:hypothetical protein